MFNRKVNFMGVEIDQADYAVINALMRAEEPMAVLRISGITNGKYSDFQLYSILDKLKAAKLVESKTEPVEIQGQKLNKRTFWLPANVRQTFSTSPPVIA